MTDNNKLSVEQVIRKILAENLYVQFLGIEIMDLRAGYGLAKMKYKKELTNPYNTLHGGSLYSLADIIAGAAACMCGHYVTTISGTLNFLLPAGRTEYVFCEAVQLRQGNHLSVFEIKITNDVGNIIDSGEFTFFLTDHLVQCNSN